MNIVKFCENRYQELTMRLQASQEYDAHLDTQTKATAAVLHLYRQALHWAYIPKTIYDFARVNLGLDPEPVPVLLNKAKKDKEEAAKKEANGREIPGTPVTVVPKTEG
jgi:hypothetical protein